MKRLVTSFTVLLLSMSANAAETLNATSGSTVINFGAQAASYSFAGADFSASGEVAFGPGNENPNLAPIPPGVPDNILLAGNLSDGTLALALTVDGTNQPRRRA